MVSYNIVHIGTHIHTQTYQTLLGILLHIYQIQLTVVLFTILVL